MILWYYINCWQNMNLHFRRSFHSQDRHLPINLNSYFQKITKICPYLRCRQFFFLHFVQMGQKQKWLSSFCLLSAFGGFHLHLLVFPFVYKFNSIEQGFQSIHDQFRRISTTFQHHCKICLLWFLHEKDCSFSLISFAVLK